MHGVNNNNLESDDEVISQRFRTQPILLNIIFLPAKLLSNITVLLQIKNVKSINNFAENPDY
jgi:hypothetical protein